MKLRGIPLDLWIRDENFEALEASLPRASGEDRLALLMEIAWHARQRDTPRTRLLLGEARALFASLPLEAQQRQSTLARLELIEGEACWLFAEIDVAQTRAESALAHCTALKDAIGCSDAHALLACLMTERGDPVQRDHHFAQAVHWARQGGDRLRTGVNEANTAIWAIFQDLSMAQTRWSAYMTEAQTDAHPAHAVWVHGFIGMLAFQKSDMAPAITHFLASYNAAAITGQGHRQIVAATNLGVAFGNLNDAQTALEWMQRGLEAARRTAWPSTLGLALVQTASIQRQLGRFEAAQQLLEEAHQVLEPLRGGRFYAMAIHYLGDVTLSRKDYPAALDAYVKLEQRARVLKQSDLQNDAQRGQAEALSNLDRPHEARALAERALANAREQNMPIKQFEMLLTLAAIYGDHISLPAPPGMVLATAPLHYLQQACEVGQAMEGFTLPPHLYDAMAREYALRGEGTRAYEIALKSIEARERVNSTEAVNRAIAMQISYQTERTRAQSEHHRQLAAAEASRAATLQQTSETLEHLSSVGQEITAQLNAATVFAVLERHVHRLLGDSRLMIFLMTDDRQSLDLAFGLPKKPGQPTLRIALDDEDANSARSVRECREIVISYAPGSPQPNHIAGTRQTLSQLFVPLKIGTRILGVMTIQTPQVQAYGARECLIFRTLCAYGAIALDNAGAYRQLTATLKTLHATQAELIEKNLALELAYREQEQSSLTDPLTGLRNRRFLLQHIETDVAVALRAYDRSPTQPPAHSDTDLLFFMIDLDHFKAVNDTYGHAAGDRVLVEMKVRLQSVAREGDYIIRWGGEEFLLVAHGMSRCEGHAIAERIRQVVVQTLFDLGNGQLLQRTCSVGFASFPFVPRQPRQLTWLEVVEVADQALYMAKHAGRNGWVGLFDTESSPSQGLFHALMTDASAVLARGDVRTEQHTASDFSP